MYEYILHLTAAISDRKNSTNTRTTCTHRTLRENVRDYKNKPFKLNFCTFYPLRSAVRRAHFKRVGPAWRSGSGASSRPGFCVLLFVVCLCYYHTYACTRLRPQLAAHCTRRANAKKMQMQQQRQQQHRTPFISAETRNSGPPRQRRRRRRRRRWRSNASTAVHECACG